MWNKVKQNGIISYTTNNEGKFTQSIPEGTASLVVTRFTNMIGWIYDEFTKDCIEHPEIFQLKDFNEQENFVTRNTSRTLSYINHVCSMEHILTRLYNETITKLNGIDSTIVSCDKGLLQRRQEVKDCFIFRNKVSAHTAYGSPKKDDNSAIQFHSLVSLLSSSYNETGSADSFALGTVSVRLSDQVPSTILPCISLKELHPKILDHIDKWISMFIDPCIRLKEKLPLSIGDTKYV